MFALTQSFNKHSSQFVHNYLHNQKENGKALEELENIIPKCTLHTYFFLLVYWYSSIMFLSANIAYVSQYLFES